MRLAFLRGWRAISCPICEKRIRERDLNGLGCPYCGTYVESDSGSPSGKERP